MRFRVWASALAALLVVGASATTPISMGGLPISGTLVMGDAEPIPADNSRAGPEYYRDGFSFHAGGGDRVAIDLSADFDCYLILLNPSGDVIAENDDHGSVSISHIVATLPMSGTHRIVVTSFSSNNGGQYTLSVTEPPPPPPTSPDSQISLGQTVQGELTPEDNAELIGDDRGEPDYRRDGYRFRGRAEQAVRIELICGFDGYLFLVDPDGQIIARNDDWGTTRASRIATTLGRSGNHRIVVTTYSAGVTGSYTLSLLEAEESDLGEQNPWGPQPVIMPEDGILQEGIPPGVDPRIYQQLGFQPPSDRGEAPGPLLCDVRLHSEPLNVVCRVDEKFLTSVNLHNATTASFDQITLVVEYDPQVLRPQRVSDHKLRPLVSGTPTLDADLEVGWIRYEASLAEPHKGTTLELLTIEWLALVPRPHTRITLATDPESGCSLRLAGREVLGEAGDPTDGTIGTEVAIRPLGDDRLLGSHQAGDPEGVQVIQGIDPTGEVALHLLPPTRPIHVGETFFVDVHLSNPKATPIDDLRFAIRFDPAVLEVIDSAAGGYPPDEDNWILRGINLLDAPFHADHPFDLHFSNQALNDVGLIDYHMGLSRPRPLPDGALARIELRALAPTTRTTLRFVHGAVNGTPTTAIRCLGTDVLGVPDSPGDGTRDLALSVAPLR